MFGVLSPILRFLGYHFRHGLPDFKCAIEVKSHRPKPSACTIIMGLELASWRGSSSQYIPNRHGSHRGPPKAEQRHTPSHTTAAIQSRSIPWPRRGVSAPRPGPVAAVFAFRALQSLGVQPASEVQDSTPDRPEQNPGGCISRKQVFLLFCAVVVLFGRVTNRLFGRVGFSQSKSPHSVPSPLFHSDARMCYSHSLSPPVFQKPPRAGAVPFRPGRRIHRQRRPRRRETCAQSIRISRGEMNLVDPEHQVAFQTPFSSFVNVRS